MCVVVTDKRANEACTQYDKANERAIAAERATAAALTACQVLEFLLLVCMSG
jgi:hypothetical protein